MGGGEGLGGKRGATGAGVGVVIGGDGAPGGGGNAKTRGMPGCAGGGGAPAPAPSKTTWISLLPEPTIEAKSSGLSSSVMMAMFTKSVGPEPPA